MPGTLYSTQELAAWCRCTFMECQFADLSVQYVAFRSQGALFLDR